MSTPASPSTHPSSFNLTRHDARRRSELLTVQRYALEIDLTYGSEEVFRSRTTISVECAEPGQSSFLDLRDATILSATLNGQPLDIETFNSTLSAGGETGEWGLALPSLQANNTIVVDAICHYSTTGEGLHRTVDAADDATYLYSQCEPADGKRVFACFDQPDMKAPFDLTVTSPSEWQVISNTSISCSDTQDDGRTTHTFSTTAPLPPYLFALCAGPYHRWEDTYTWEGSENTQAMTIPLALYCRESLAQYFDPETIFELTKGGFDYYHRTFGILYPFPGSYDQVFVPDFNAGAMENAGCVTYREDYVFRSHASAGRYERRADTVLHEMAHMWFGDLVTMRWWDDLWLNESFASWASVMAQCASTVYTEAWTTFIATQKNWAYHQDALPSTHPIATRMECLDDLEANFDGITYAKGCAVLKQLVAYAGLEPFLQGLRDYLTTHAYSNATFQDLLAAVSVYTQKDFHAWATNWLTTTGRNTIDIQTTYDEATKQYTSASIQQTEAQGGAEQQDGPRPHRLGVGLYSLVEGKLVRQQYIDCELPATTDPVPLPQLEGRQAYDLILPNDEDLTYCSVKVDERSLRTILDHLQDIEDSLARALCWGILEDSTWALSLNSHTFITTLVQAWPYESSLSVAEHELISARRILQRYTNAQWAHKQGWPALTHMLLEVLHHPKWGQEQQIIAFNALCTCVLDDEVLDVLSAVWNEGPDAAGLAGVPWDTDRQWLTLTALAAHGRATAEDINAMLSRDNTNMGIRRAHTARAAIPTAEAKEAAWALLTCIGEDALSNWNYDAVLDGVLWAGQDELLQPYTQRYCQDLPTVLTHRPGEIAQTFTQRAFPHWATVEQAEQCVQNVEHLPGGTGRYVREALSDVRRAAAARDRAR